MSLDRLPQDVRMIIFALLPSLQSLVACSLVCRSWRSAVRCLSRVRLANVTHPAPSVLPSLFTALKELDITTRADSGLSADTLVAFGALSSLEHLSVSCERLSEMALHTMAPNEGKLPNLRSLRISTCRDASGLWCLPRAALEVPIDLAARLTELDVSWYQLADSNLEDLMQRAPQCRVRYHGRPLDVECIVARRTDYRHGLIIKEILDSEKLFLEALPDCRLFMRLMHLYRDQGMISQDCCRDLLGMLPSLIDAGQRFYSEACGHPQALPSVFIRYAIYFNVMAHHAASNADHSMQLSDQQPDVDKLFQARPETRVVSLDLDLFSLQELMRHTPTSDDSAQGNQALTLLEGVLSRLSERKHNAEAIQQVLNIQAKLRGDKYDLSTFLAPGRVLVLQSVLQVLTSDGTESLPRLVLLFTDLLLVVKVEGSGANETYIVCEWILFHDSVSNKVCDLDDKSLRLERGEECLVLLFAEVEDKRRWVQALRAAVKAALLKHLKSQK